MSCLLWFALFAGFGNRAAAQLDEHCTVTLLNRSTQVQPGGWWGFSNLPQQPGFYRVRASCTRDGVTTVGQSDYISLFAVPPDIDIAMGFQEPMPVALRVDSPLSSLTAKGQSVRLTATAVLPDGTTKDVPGPSQGTFWVSSNPEIATVNAEGLVQAVARGVVIIQANNEGVVGAVTINLVIPNDADNDQMTDEFERANGLNPNDASDAGQDRDSDGLSNLQEFRLNTNPRSPDSDGDGLLDGDEVVRSTNPLLADSDGDGLADGQEVSRGSNPLSRDTDADGIADGIEVELGLSLTSANPVTTIQGRVVDTQGVTVTNAAVTVMRVLTVNTDVAGFFSLSGVPAGLGPITAEAEIVRIGQLLNGTSLAAAPVAGGITAVGTIEIGLNAGTVAGLVTNPQGLPVPGALVSVSSGNDTRNATADANGRYRVANMSTGVLQVKARDFRSGLRGLAVGELVVNSAVTINVRLAPFGSVGGTVLAQDNATPVGAGVLVNFAGPSSQATATDPLGRYTFEFAPLGGYAVDASDTSGNRGRSSGNLSATAQVNVNDIAFLGRGRVVGVVRDGASNPVNGANVRLFSGSVFGGQFNATTDGAGRYAISNVFVGTFQVTAQSGQFAGQVGGAILQEGQTVTNNLTLAGAASIAGVVFRADGLTPIGGVRVTLSGLGLGMETDDEGRFRFDALPLTGYTLDAVDTATADRGRSGAVLSTQGEVRTANIVLNGLGNVVVTVRNGPGDLVPGASVRVNGSTQFGGSFTGTTSSEGTAAFPGVFAGGFSSSATDPVTGLAGSVSGTVTVGGTTNVVVRLQSYGSILGRVFQPNGTEGAPGLTVRISGQVGRSTTTGLDGSYRFDLVPTSSYSVDALDASGRLRARATGVVVSTQGQEASQNLTLIGLGSVAGIVRDDEGQPGQNIGVSLSSQAGAFGGSFFARTDVTGRYRIEGVPVGAFTLNASVRIDQQQCFGSAQGSIASHEQGVTADLQLDCSLIPSTTTLYDANNFAYSVRENASIQDGGPGSMYGGDFATRRGGFLLDVIVGGSTNRFVGQEFATSEEGGRQLSIRQNELGGLNVTRQVYVPRDGYFVRYLEILSNPTGSPITATIQVSSHYRFIQKVQNGFQFDREPRLISTSSGDAVLSIADAVTGDRWLVVDDDEDVDPFVRSTDLPSVADVFEGTNAPTRVSAAVFSVDFNNRFGRLVRQWSNVTIPAGGSVAFLHFGSQQVNRAAAQASAERLTGLPPEALVGMTLEQMGLVRNFAMPSNGVSTQVPLAPLTGTIEGRTLSGDGTTPIGGATVSFQSRNVLFGRTYNLRANSASEFRIAGSINGQGSSVAVPVGEFALTGAHPLSGGLSAPQTGNFPSGVLNTTQDVLFSDSGNLMGTVRRHNGVVASSGTVVVSGGALLNPVTLRISSSGTFGLNGLPSSTYNLTVTVPVAQGSDLKASISFTVVAGQTSAADVVMPETGTVTGLVQREGGAPAVNLAVSLRGENNLARNATTDTGGRFSFFDVPAGLVILDVYDAFSNTAGHAEAIAVGDQTVTANMTLIAGGSVAGTVTQPNGQTAAGAQVTLTSVAGQFTGVTDDRGRYEFFLIPPGPVSVRVNDPATALRAFGSGNLALSGQTLTLNLALTGLGSITGTVLLTDAVTPLAGAVVQLTGAASRTATTDAQGRYLFDFVPLRSFTVQSTHPTTGERGSFDGQLTVNLEVRQANIILTPNITVADTSVVEGNVGTTNAIFDVRLSSPAAQEVRVNYATGGGTAVANLDYQLTSGTLVFPPGTTNRSVVVPVVGEVLIEPSETFLLTLSAAVNATITDAQGTALIANDDGQIGEIHHFAWTPVASPQFINQAFPVTLTALDAFNTLVEDFAGPVALSAVAQVPDLPVGTGQSTWNWPLATYYHDARCQSIYLASEIGPAREIGGLALEVTSVPGQRMNAFTIRMRHTSLSGYAPNQGWESSGWTTVFQSNVTVQAAGPLVLRFPTPFQFNGVDNLLVDFSFNNGSYTADGTTRSTETVLNRSLFYRTDSGSGDPLNWAGVDPQPSIAARVPYITLLGSRGSIAMAPTTTAAFSNGLWTGNVVVQDTGTNLVLVADDGDGHKGSSQAFTVLVRDDVGISMVDTTDPAPVGAPLTYLIAVTNSGPASATGVVVTNVLPTTVAFTSVVASQGSCEHNDGVLRCELGTLLGGSNALVTLTVIPQSAGLLANEATVGRAEADPYPPNNTASAFTTVLLPGLSIDDVSRIEGNLGNSPMTFRVRLSYPSGGNVTVNFATTNGTALAGLDYTTTSGTVTLAAGQTEAVVNVPILGDTNIEDGETFRVRLSGAVGASIIDGEATGTILNDDGVIGGVHSFAWDAISSPQFIGEPFAASLRALDVFGNLVPDFEGTVSLAAVVGGGQATNTILGELSNLQNFTGTYTIGFSFTPSTNLLVTHVRHISGTKVSIWRDDGQPVLSQPVSSTPGTWLDTALPTPVTLQSGTRYRLALYQPNGLIYYRSPVPSGFTNGTIDQIVYTPNDAFPTTTASGYVYLVDIRYLVGDSFSTSVAPERTGAFMDGAWSGEVTVPVAADELRLVADDLDGHTGRSVPFASVYRNDLIVRLSDTPDPAPVGQLLTYTAIVTNTGPGAATGIRIVDTLPSSVTPVSATVAGGSCETVGSVVTCTLASLAAGTAADVLIVVRPNAPGALVNSVQVTRDGADGNESNNTATAGTLVLLPTLSVADVSIEEGNSGVTTATLDVRLSHPSPSTVTVNYITANGTATSADFISASGSLSFPPGTTNRTVSVSIVGDLLLEPDETILLNLSSPNQATLADGQATLTILNDELIPDAIVVVSESCQPGNNLIDPGEVVTAEFVLRNPGRLDLNEVTATLLEGGGVVGPSGPQNYGTVAGGGGSVGRQFSFVANGACGASVTATFQLQDSRGNLGFVTFSYVLGTILTFTEAFDTVTPPAIPSGWTSAGSGSSTGWRTRSDIRDSSPNSIFVNAPGSSSVSELTSPAFGVTAANSEFSFRHRYSTESCCDGGILQISINGGAFTEILQAGGSFLQGGYNGSRWSGSSGGFITSRFAMPPSAIGQSVRLRWRLTTDTSVSGEGWYVDTVILNEAQCCLSPTAIDLAVSVSDTPDPIILGNLLSYAVSVTNRGPAAATGVMITNTLPPGATLVSAGALNGCVTLGADVVCSLGSLAAGTATNAVFTVNAPLAFGQATNIVAVGATEQDFNLANNRATAVTTVNRPGLTVSDVVVTEGNSGTTNANFAINLSAPIPLAVTVAYRTSDNTASVGTDYVGTNGVATLAPGTTNLVISVGVLGDTLNEINESFFFTLINPTNAVLSDSSALATILNDDPLPILRIADVRLTEGNVGISNVIFEVTLSGPSGRTVSVNFSTSNGTAVAGEDYLFSSGSIRFDPGQTNKWIVITVAGDTKIEPDENFFVNLSSPSTAALGDGQGECIISNDDGLPGAIHSFQWSAISSPQYAGEAFAATVTARDGSGAIISDYSETVGLRGRRGGLESTNNLFGDRTSFFGSSGNYTMGYVFTPGTNLLVTHVRHFAGTRVSIWNNAGDLLIGQPVSSSPGSWRQTELAQPVELRAGNVYRIGMYTGGSSYYYTDIQSVTNGFRDGVINAGSYSSGDAIPRIDDSTSLYVVDFVYRVGATGDIGVEPEAIDFVDGTWTGSIRVVEPGEDVSLIVDDQNGHLGISDPFEVELRNDLAVSISDAPDPADVGTNLTYSITITNVGPSVSTGVMLTNEIPVESIFVSATASQGDCESSGNLLVCDLGTVSDSALVTVVVRPTADQTLTNLARVTRTEVDNYPVNNTAQALTRVNSLRGGVSAGRVAILAAEDVGINEAVESMLRDSGLFSAVESFDVRNGNPWSSYEELQAYDAVLVYSDYSFGDAEGLGDLLADYVDQGGGVVVAVFALDSSGGLALTGRIQNDEYLPILPSSSNNGGEFYLVPDRPDHPILREVATDAADSFQYTYDVALAQGAEQVAHWSDGPLAVATREVGGGRVVALNLYPPYAEAAVGARLMANALAWAGGDVVALPEDLSLAVTTSTTEVPVESELIYTLRVENSGPSDATGLILSNRLGTIVSLVAANASQGSCDEQEGLVTCGLGTLAAGEHATVTITVRAQISGMITNIATVSRNEADFYTPNNRSTLITVVEPPLLEIGDATVAEGDEGEVQVVLEATLSNPSALPVSTLWLTGNGSAFAGSDYRGTNGPLVFAPGQTNVTVSIQVLGDLLDESDEFFFVYVGAVTNATYVRSGTVTITDDDPLPSTSFEPGSVQEGDLGSTNLILIARLAPASGRQVSVSYSTEDASAGSGVDYQASTGSIIFQPGQTNASVSIRVFGDYESEANETFLLRLSSPVGAMLANTEVSGTILDDDSTPKPVVLLQQPMDQVGIIGLPTSFGVLAGGTPPLAYQWLRNDASIPGATGAVFTLSQVVETNAGLYSVLVTNVVGGLLSSNAALTLATSGMVGFFTDLNPGQDGMSGPIGAAGLSARRIPDIANEPLGGLRILAINEASNSGMSAALQNRLPAIEAWVRGGGRLIVHDRTTGTTSSNRFLFGAPGTQSVRSSSVSGRVIPPGEGLVVDGPFGILDDDMLNSVNTLVFGHVSGSTLPEGSQPVLHAAGNTNSVIAFSYPLGAGHVYYSSILLDCYLAGGGCESAAIAPVLAEIYLPNVLAYMNSVMPEGGFPSADRLLAGDTSNVTTQPQPQRFLLSENRTLPPEEVVIYMGWSGRSLTIRFATLPGRAYVVEFTDSLNRDGWRPLKTLQGDGSVQQIVCPSDEAELRFYRVRMDSGK
jgi:uncharacterized repeat protein (TIGR01451 family)